MRKWFREGDRCVVMSAEDGFCAVGFRGFREADHGVAEAAASQVCEDSGRGMRGQCPGRWRRWKQVPKSPRIQGILSNGSCSRAFCRDKLSPGCLRPRIPGRSRARPEVAEVAYGQEL